MGEQKDGGQNDGDKKKKAAEAGATVVLKMDLHCDGCAKKVKRTVKHFDGVEDVKIDSVANKITVTGKVDPTKLRERLEEKTQKKVELVSHSASPSPPSQQPKGGGGSAEKKPESKKADESKKKKKVEGEKPKESTVVLKIGLHCAGCIKKIKKIVAKVKGVESVTVEEAKDLVILKGTMEVNGLAPYLKDKLKRNVEVAPPKKEEAATDGGEKKDGGNGGKKEEGKKGESNVVNVEVNKMQYGGYPEPPPPSYWNYPPMYGAGPSYITQPFQSHHVDSYYGGGYPIQAHAIPVNDGYVMDHRVHAPQMFSDENPNGCSIM
ncbi:heavy metal-associated isoprenylated plant protein 3-like isoform X2 [Rhodamnia argentea]|uniref:Heavy metal-associated isoprenylated plant protein 3-like isoform X2 n=1 Tax=Rhodamnia argentea TaxID=178133 RepID=A0ABM3HNP4_9MYRT|nr:heavy metal-associated isoprenylated plant protein 3-like isoform X2 [Rhodamnia argentea]